MGSSGALTHPGSAAQPPHSPGQEDEGEDCFYHQSLALLSCPRETKTYLLLLGYPFAEIQISLQFLSLGLNFESFWSPTRAVFLLLLYGKG